MCAHTHGAPCYESRPLVGEEHCQSSCLGRNDTGEGEGKARGRRRGQGSGIRGQPAGSKRELAPRGGRSGGARGDAGGKTMRRQEDTETRRSGDTRFTRRPGSG
jgi:hypothetical protein